MTSSARSYTDGYYTGTVSQIQAVLHEPPAINFSFPPLHPKRDQQATKTTHFYARCESGWQSELRTGLLLRKTLPKRCSHSTP